jgi:hypothetical protein
MASLCFALWASSALAQDCPPVEVYAQQSQLRVDAKGIASRQGTNGFAVGIDTIFTKSFAVEFEFSHYHGNYITVPPNPGVSDDLYLAGPRVNIKWLFVHGLFGGDHLYDVAFSNGVAQPGFTGAIGGGAERKVSGPWSVRGTMDYVFSRHSVFNGPTFTQNNFRFGVGIAYTFHRESGNY